MAGIKCFLLLLWIIKQKYTFISDHTLFLFCGIQRIILEDEYDMDGQEASQIVLDSTQQIRFLVWLTFDIGLLFCPFPFPHIQFPSFPHKSFLFSFSLITFYQLGEGEEKKDASGGEENASDSGRGRNYLKTFIYIQFIIFNLDICLSYLKL